MANVAEVEGRFSKAKEFFRNGEFFRSYDLAEEARQEYPGEVRFAHLAVLSLANAGALDLAVGKYFAYGLDGNSGLEQRTLLARLKKDEGFAAAGEERLALHREARHLYEVAYVAAAEGHAADAYFPGINAAALALWTGEREEAQRLAREVLALLGTRGADGVAEDGYWMLATALEAEFILGDFEKAGKIADALRTAGDGSFAAIASTGRQMRRLADAVGVHPPFLDGLTPPRVIHYTGHIVAAPGRLGRFSPEEEPEVSRQIREVLAEEGVGSGYGSLAAGADILFAEALLARGAKLNVILPFALNEFVEQSVVSAGEGWVRRFHACLEAASTVRYATEESYLEDDTLFHYCSRLGMGLAVLAARHMQAPVMQMAVWDGAAASGFCGTVADMKVWVSGGRAQRVIRCGPRTVNEDFVHTPAATGAAHRGQRQIRAMLFGDVCGFSKLTDVQLPAFTEHIMGPVAKVTRRYREHVALVNTWGDAVFTVFEDAEQAAAWALDTQRAMAEVDLATAGLPGNLQLRLGGHLGPAYELADPVIERKNFYGAHVSRAARIEPVTPEGCVYVTETFAAILALEAPGAFACDYVGYTEMAKHYGRLRMFLLRAVAGDRVGPAVLLDIERPPVQ